MPPAKKTSAKKSRPRSTAKYIRNLHAVPVSLRFSEQTSGRRIELRPRGERGDIQKVNKDELEDTIFMLNQDSLFELLTANQAADTLEKQTWNQQKRSPIVDMLRNELGEPIDSVVMKKSPQEEAITVAHIEQTGATNRLQQGEVIHRGIEVKRAPVPGSQDNPGPQVPDHIDPEHAADWVARNAEQQGIEGPQAGLGGYSVGGINPVQRG